MGYSNHLWNPRLSITRPVPDGRLHRIFRPRFALQPWCLIRDQTSSCQVHAQAPPPRRLQRSGYFAPRSRRGLGIRAFHLRGPFQTGRFVEFFRLGSRFIAGERHLTVQVLARSTRLKSRLPGGTELQDIFRRVDIPVVSRSAIGARPFADPQRHLLLVASAVATGLAAGKPAVYHDHLPPVPRGFVLDLPPKLAHAHVGNRAGQAVVLAHASHVQVFQSDDIGLADHGGRGLVQEIRAAGGDTGVNPGDFQPLLAAAIAAFLHSGQAPLLALQMAQPAFQMARVAGLHGLFTIPTDHHVLDAQIQTDRFPGQWGWLNRDFTGKADEVAPVRRLGNGRHFRGAGGNLRPPYLNRAQLGQFEEFARLIIVGNLALIQRVAHRLPVVATLELRIAPALLEEVFERLILIHQALRQTAGGAISQPRKFTALPFGDLPIQRNVVMALLALFPGFAAQVQTAVP